MKNENYIVIQGWMINELKLSGNELMLYALIYGFSQDGESEFYGTLSYIEKGLQLSRPTVISLLKKLQKKGLIEKTKESHYITTSKETLLVKNVSKVVKKLNYTSKETLPLASKETLPNIYNTNNNTNYNNIYNNSPEKEIFNFWNEQNIVKHKFESVENDIEKALKKFSLEEIKIGIKNYSDVYHSNKTWWTYKWTLSELLKRENGLKVFIHKTEQDYIKKDFNQPKSYRDNGNASKELLEKIKAKVK